MYTLTIAQISLFFRWIRLEDSKVTCFNQVTLTKDHKSNEPILPVEVPDIEKFPDREFWDFSSSSYSPTYELLDTTDIKTSHHRRPFNNSNQLAKYEKESSTLRCYTSAESQSRPLLYFSVSCSIIANCHPDKNRFWKAYCLCYDTEDKDAKTGLFKLKWIGDLGLTMCNDPKIRADVVDLLTGVVSTVVGQTKMWK